MTFPRFNIKSPGFFSQIKFITSHVLLCLQSNPTFVVGQNWNFWLHFHVIKGWIVVTGQVVSVVVVIDRLVMFRIISKLLHIRIQLEHFALVRDCLNIVFILVWRFKERALFRNKREIQKKKFESTRQQTYRILKIWTSLSFFGMIEPLDTNNHATVCSFPH